MACVASTRVRLPAHRAGASQPSAPGASARDQVNPTRPNGKDPQKGGYPTPTLRAILEEYELTESAAVGYGRAREEAIPTSTLSPAGIAVLALAAYLRDEADSAKSF